MNKIKFECAIEDISPRQLEYIVKVFNELGLNEAKAVFEVVGKKGDNFTANVKRVVIEQDGNILNMIVKIAPTNQDLRDAMNITLLFHNEHVIYTEVFPKFTTLEKSADIPESQRLRYPICYGFQTEVPYEVIMLEDLKESEFIMLSKNKSLSDDAVKFVLLNFAKLHSLSYAWKTKEPENFESVRNKLKNVWNDNNTVTFVSSYLIELERDLINMFDDMKYKKALEGVISNMPKNLQRIKVDENTKYSVIIQGDAWTNNIMFCVKDDNVRDCCMIDYQQSRNNSPVSDILYMIFLCTDHATRAKHYNDWIAYYHSELAKHLNNFELKASFIYPRDQLDADLKRHAKFIFSLVVFLKSIMNRETNEVTLSEPDAVENEQNNLEYSGNAASTDETLSSVKEVTQGLLDSYLEFGYL